MIIKILRVNRPMSNKLFSVNRIKGGRLFYALNRLMSAFAYRMLLLARIKEDALLAEKQLVQDLTEGSLQRSGYIDHYTEKQEISVWHRYRKTYEKETVQSNEIVFRADYMKTLLCKILDDNPNLSGWINIGCSYGWLENQIATNYPNLKVIGIDRSSTAMDLNKSEFSEVQNLEFIADDFNKVFQNRPEIFKNVVVTHINFGVYFLPTLLQNLYKNAYNKGCDKIIVFEPSGISRITHRHYQYSEQNQKPAIFRGQMLLNNYPNLLKESGFNLEFADKVKPPHPHPDFYSVCFVGSRTKD